MSDDLDLDPAAMLLSLRDVRFALSILCEVRCLGELANVMEGCLYRDVGSLEFEEKRDAFVAGITALNRSGVPCAVSFLGGTA